MQPTHPSITDLASVPQSQRPQQHLGSLQTGDHNTSSIDACEMLAQLFNTSHANIAWAVSVMGASIVVIGLTGGSLGSCHGETVQMYIVAIMIELKSALHYLVPGLLFNLPHRDYCSPLYNVSGWSDQHEMS